MYLFNEITKETLQEYKDKQEISMFKYATDEICNGPDFKMKTLQIENDKEDIVAFATITLGENACIIDEFEVLHSLRRKGIGKSIINQIQNEFDKIELYPQDVGAMEFWKKCGFNLSYEDCGTILMTWQNKENI